MYDDMRTAIASAAQEDQKLVMFHLQVLMNAPTLSSVDPGEFCRRVGVPDSFKTEFRKMIALRRLMQSKGIELR